ncbi:recombinase RecX [Flavobacteriaceae bacterium R38]|nr:recombinase RecX [Flavobacteriaceae bacterium R38]
MKEQKSYTVDEATKKLEYFCAYQDRCHKEVISKLRNMNMIPQAIDHIVTHLIKDNFLNEERFAKSFARGKFRVKKWGKRRIVQELKLRDISKYNIKTALKEINEEDYFQVFHELAEKRWEQLEGEKLQVRKKKFIDYLLYRGWESNMVYEKMNDFIR